MKTKMRYVVAAGDLEDGFRVFGAFETEGHAWSFGKEDVDGPFKVLVLHSEDELDAIYGDDTAQG